MPALQMPNLDAPARWRPNAPSHRTARMRRPTTRSPGLLALLFAACTAPDSTMSPSTGSPPTGAPAQDPAAVDVRSCARPREVRVRHIALDLQLDFDQRVARGSATLD